MARLINDIADLKKHIVVSATFDFQKVMPHAKRVERKLIHDLIGQDQYDAIVVHTLDEQADAAIDQVKMLLQEAVSHYALFVAMPSINILITNSGSKVTQPQDAANADWKDKLDLNRYLVKTYHEAIDDAFKIMEKNTAVFSEWASSEYYTVFKDLIVQQTSIFNKHFSIQNSRPTFMALQPLLREVEDQYFTAMLGDATLNIIKSHSSDAIIAKAQERAHKAAVALTVAKAAENGMFCFTDFTMSTVSAAQPWETKTHISDDRLFALKSARQNAGEEHLKELKKFIVANPAKFPDYSDRKETGLSQKIIKKKSGLWL